MQKNKLIHTVTLSLTLIGLCLSAIGCSKKAKAEDPKPSGPMSVNVVGFKTLQKDLSDTIFVVGTLVANESVNITNEINGIIQSINFKEGQKVEKGDVLFQIEKNKLQAGYDQAVANLRLAESTAKRYKNLVQSKAVSQQEYDETVATLASNRAAVQLAKEQLEDATIIAPFSGVMGERMISIGQFVSPGAQLSSLYNQDPIKVAFHVPERYLGDVAIGQMIEMKVASYSDKTYNGDVYFIDPKIDETTRTVLVKAYVDNPTGELREGMFANIELIVEIRKDAILIPETALIVKADEVFVYVVKEDQTVELRSIQTGARNKGMVGVREGLSKEEVVIVEGYQKLGPGSPVNVRFEDVTEKKPYEII